MYYELLSNNMDSSNMKLPIIPDYATNNGHIFYLLCSSLDYRTRLMEWMKEKGVQLTFHYLPLHSSQYYQSKYVGKPLPNCDHYADCLVRLPLYYELKDEEVKQIAQFIIEFSQKL